MALSNESLALTLLVDATADTAREAGQTILDSHAAEARRLVRQAAEQRQGGDIGAMMLAAAMAVTVLVPYLIGHFLMTRTFVLKPDPGVYETEARGLKDHFFGTYLAGLIPIVLLLGVFLVARRPWAGRQRTVVIGWAAIAAGLVLILPSATAHWHASEQKTIAKLRETAVPFDKRFMNCASWEISAENGLQQPELWQVHLGQLKGSEVDGCNRVNVYRGWMFVGAYNLPDGDTFTEHVIVNHEGWPKPYEAAGSGTVGAVSKKTGLPVPMNPIATNVELKTKQGRSLQFSLDGAGHGGFDLR